jgi:lipid-A-disaccharide synthase
LIDYIGANLSMGKFIRSQFPKVPIVYYIAPQEWVWSMNDRNTHQIVDITDRLLAIFPEEARYYERQGAAVKWIGHPLVDRLQDAPNRETARASLGIPAEEKAIVLSPASRKQELKFLMPEIFAAAQKIQAQVPQAKFYIPLALDRYRGEIEAAVQSYGLNAKLIPKEDGQTAIAAADLAITKSGTINLELALLNVPQVVIYRISKLTAWVGRKILKVKIVFASPVNLVPMRLVVPELLQEEANADRIAQESLALLEGPARDKMLEDYQVVQAGLGETGVCDRAAAEIFALF